MWLAGRLVEARALLDDPDGRLGSTDPLLRRFTTIGLVTLLEDLSLIHISEPTRPY